MGRHTLGKRTAEPVTLCDSLIIQAFATLNKHSYQHGTWEIYYSKTYYNWVAGGRFDSVDAMCPNPALAQPLAFNLNNEKQTLESDS